MYMRVRIQQFIFYIGRNMETETRLSDLAVVRQSLQIPFTRTYPQFDLIFFFTIHQFHMYNFQIVKISTH